MRLFEAPSTLLSLVTLLLSTTQTAHAGPFSRLTELVEQLSHDIEDAAISLQNSTLDELELKKRQTAAVCSSSQFSCGYYKQLCCATGSQTCGTNAADEAICVNVAGGGGGVVAGGGGGGGNGVWQLYTTIWTTTGAVTMTSVYSSLIPAQVTGAATGDCVPNWANGQSQCGVNCCESGMYCFDIASGVCKPAGGTGFTTTGIGGAGSGGGGGGGGIVLPPTRPTTISGVLTTVTMTPTTTVAYSTPIATGQNGTITPVEANAGGGLSGGAIAGIVIGVIAGIILLILLLLCCCLKAGFDGILALFGIGKKKEKRRVVEETYVDRYSRYGSQAGSGGRRWYGAAGASAGGRPGRPPPPKEKKAKFGGLGAVGLGLGGLAIALGLKRKHDRKHDEKSDVSSSYYDSYYSYGSSKSSQSA